MPIPLKYLADFVENETYHVFNRTNNKEKLFLTDENRRFFLKRYKDLLGDVIDTYAWCLLPNHFHLLIRVKPLEELKTQLLKIEGASLTISERKFLQNECTVSELIEQRFKRFFQSYALAFNKVHKRNGNLFYKPFKRIWIECDTHFTQAIIYIHTNPVKHHVCKDFTTYQWSSWKTMLSAGKTDLLRTEVMDWFGNKALFVEAHVQQMQYEYDIEISRED